MRAYELFKVDTGPHETLHVYSVALLHSLELREQGRSRGRQSSKEACNRSCRPSQGARAPCL